MADQPNLSIGDSSILRLNFGNKLPINVPAQPLGAACEFGLGDSKFISPASNLRAYGVCLILH